MTTAEMYRLGSVAGPSTAVLGPQVRIVVFPHDDVVITGGGTDEAAAHTRAMRELAALSVDPGSLGRALEEEINRDAWGIHGE